MSETRRLWAILAGIMAVSFAVLLLMGREIFQAAPPMPERVVSETGAVIYTRGDIETGRQVWQSMGGHQTGSIWGHGSYVAPDWTADWLHRESLAVMDQWSTTLDGVPYDALPPDRKAALEARLPREMRANTFEPETATIVVSE